MTREDSRATSLAVFETGLGWIGLAWKGQGLTNLHLPESTREATIARLRSRAGATCCEAAPTGVAATAVELITRLCSGEVVELTPLVIDIGGVGTFRSAIYDAARRIGHGETTTYGALCAVAGYPGRARETGQAMATNPLPLIIPCHRVLASGGRIGGFSAPGGASAKLRLLDLERARPPSPPGQAAFAF